MILDIIKKLFFRNGKKLSNWDILALITSVLYLLASLTFVFGSGLFLSYFVATYGIQAAWAFVFGSAGFILASLLDMYQSWFSLASVAEKLAHATTVCYFVGSVLFEFGSTLYLLPTDGCSPDYLNIIFSYAATEFLVACILFEFGSFFNLMRLYLETPPAKKEEDPEKKKAKQNDGDDGDSAPYTPGTSSQDLSRFVTEAS